MIDEFSQFSFLYTSSVTSNEFIESNFFWTQILIRSINFLKRICGDLNPVNLDILASKTFILAFSLIMVCSSVHSVVFSSKIFDGLGEMIDNGRGALVFFLFLKLIGLVILSLYSLIFVGLFTFRSQAFLV